MLTVTPAAAEAVDAILANSEAPDIAGLLDGHVLDAEDEDRNVAFSLHRQDVNGATE
jgi:hypothetical protein